MDLSRHHTQFTAEHRTTAAGMEPGEYLRLLHPPGSVGQPTMMQLDGETRHARTVLPEILPWLADAWVDVSAYVTLNRYHGPRSCGRLADLNALYLDLDVHRSDRFAGRDRAGIFDEILAECARRTLPEPSLVLDTGRGLAAIWLLDPLPPAALKRWRAAMDCLIRLFASWQADRACSDPARVFRVPGSINLKCGREVTVIGGSCRRYGFDDLADAIFVAAGRPTRAELAARKAEMETRSAPRKKSGGLSPSARFAQIRQDLDTLARHWGGRVPEGLRNIWLHLHAACLTHLHDVDIAAEVETAASRATPGLAASEVAAIVRAAVKAADRSDRRYHYSGARVAELLGVDDALARRLGLRQVHSEEERRRRRRERETARRREEGTVSRAKYLATNRISSDKPWEAFGWSRATWYRRGRPEPATTGCDVQVKDRPSVRRESDREESCDDDETGPRPLQGGLPRGTPRAGAAGAETTSPTPTRPPAEPPRDRPEVRATRPRAMKPLLGGPNRPNGRRTIGKDGPCPLPPHAARDAQRQGASGLLERLSVEQQPLQEISNVR